MFTMKLGTIVHDKVSDVDGMLTHLRIDMDNQKEYIFQPKNLHPETGQPVDKILVSEARILHAVTEDLNPPTDILGSHAEDTGTGFKGSIVTLIYHLDGCLHIEIKPKGINKKTGGTTNSHEFDIRRCIGPKIKKMTGAELQESIKAKPSPVEGITRMSH